MQLLERFLVSLVVVVVLVGLLVQANLEEDPAGSAVNFGSDTGVSEQSGDDFKVFNESGQSDLDIQHGSIKVGHSSHGIKIVSWRWDEYRTKFIITLTVLLCSLFKILFHKLEFISENVPESCLLIMMGLVVGLICAQTVETSITAINLPIIDIRSYTNILPKLSPDLFFNYLLPPVILNSAFTLYDREFLTNLSSVLVFAVLGTLINVIIIGVVLYLLSTSGALGSTCSCIDLSLVEAFIFSSLISAVDPVAVLAIFEDIHVNMSLYFLVFGESLLNDGVTVVLYNTMIALMGIEVGATEIFTAIISFLFVTLGGSFIGILFGFATSLTTKFTKDVRVIEPVLVGCYCYLGFILTEMLHWSGIISIITFGLTVKRYAFNNISNKSYTTIKYGSQCMASISDCVIFLFLGLALFMEQQRLEAGFVIATILLCFAVRFMSTLLLSYLVNLRRTSQISTQEQMVMAYGGLRGAVGFSLAMVLDSQFEHKKLFLTSALAMVFFTVFLQGSTIKPIVKWLKIKLDTKQPKSMTLTIQEKLLAEVMGGIEAVVGSPGTFWLFEKFKLFEEKHLKKFLLSKDATETLSRKLTHRMLDKHFTHLYAPTIIAKREVDETTQTPRPRTFSHAEDLNAFRRGTRYAEWGKVSNKSDSDSSNKGAHGGGDGLANGLRLRDKRFTQLQDRVLSIRQPAREDQQMGDEAGDSPLVIRRNSVAPHMYSQYKKAQLAKRERLCSSLNSSQNASCPTSPTSTGLERSDIFSPEVLHNPQQNTSTRSGFSRVINVIHETEC